MRSISLPCLSVLASLIILGFFGTPCPAVTGKLKNISWQKTMELYREVPCLTQDEIEYGGQVIAGLIDNSSRIFSKLALMNGINFAKTKVVTWRSTGT